MIPTITLKPGTAFVTVHDIPSMIAEALHPKALDGQSRTITTLMKIGGTNDDPIDETNGEPSDDPRPLRHEDWELLNSVWASLPAYRDDLSPSEWEPYARAWESYGNRPWRLEVFWKGSTNSDGMQRAVIVSEHYKELTRAADEGSLIPRSLARVPLIGAMGESLMRAIVTIPDLSSYVECFGIAVEVAVSLPVRPEPQPPAQSEMPVDLWMIPDPRDSKLKPYAPWGLSARYFARLLVKKDPSYLDRKSNLAKAVQEALSDVRIYKRGNKKEPVGTDTIRNAFSHLDFSTK